MDTSNSKDANKSWNARNSRDADEVGLLADSYSSDASKSTMKQQNDSISRKPAKAENHQQPQPTTAETRAAAEMLL
jgi:hypothetical protein